MFYYTFETLVALCGTRIHIYLCCDRRESDDERKARVTNDEAKRIEKKNETKENANFIGMIPLLLPFFFDDSFNCLSTDVVYVYMLFSWTSFSLFCSDDHLPPIIHWQWSIVETVGEAFIIAMSSKPMPTSLTRHIYDHVRMMHAEIRSFVAFFDEVKFFCSFCHRNSLKNRGRKPKDELYILTIHFENFGYNRFISINIEST